MIAHYTKNRQSIKIAMVVIAIACVLVPLLPLTNFMGSNGVGAALIMFIMVFAYAFFSAQWMPFGTQSVRVFKIIDPTTMTVLQGHQKTPLKLYGVIAASPKQAEMYEDSLAFIENLLSLGSVQIKAMPESYKVKNQRIKYSRVFVDGVDVAEEGLRQGRLWLDPNFAVLRSYRDAENEGKTWNRGQFKGLRDGTVTPPFKFALQQMNAKQEESRRNLFVPKKEKATQWGV